jgi:ketosteroid isomerase-like protein
MESVSFHPGTTERFIDRLAVGQVSEEFGPGNVTVRAGNLERLQECYRAIARGDFTVMAAIMADDVDMELTGPPLVPVAGRWLGREQVEAASRANFARLADQRAELLAVAAIGDDVVMFAREQGRVRASGAVYDVLWSQQYTFRDGLIVRIRGVFAAPEDGVDSGEA